MQAPLLGEDQARAIYERVRQYVSEAELDRRAFMVGDAYYFQGDERDVMFLSLVETGEGRFVALTRKADQQRFNVAASRAKDQMWIVHSVDPNVFHEQDLRGRLLRYYSGEGRRIENWKRVEEVLTSKTPDDEFYFQRLVARAIVDRGYAVRAEVRVGHFRIDLVVDGTSDSLAVECDGDRWHPLEKTEEDIKRQLVLERMGWRFARIRGGEYFRHPGKALEPLWRRLEEFGIHPVTVNGDPTTEDGVAKEIQALAETSQAAEVSRIRRPGQHPVCTNYRAHQSCHRKGTKQTTDSWRDKCSRSLSSGRAWMTTAGCRRRKADQEHHFSRSGWGLPSSSGCLKSTSSQPPNRSWSGCATTPSGTAGPRS